jgi:hypothetical protein
VRQFLRWKAQLACRSIDHDAQERYPGRWTLSLMLGQRYLELGACLP